LSPVTPRGTEAPGCPVMLNGKVKRIQSYGSRCLSTVSFTVCYRRFGCREFTVPTISVRTTRLPTWRNPAEYAGDGHGVKVCSLRFISPPKR
jgi:hypothetical protein